MSDVLFQLFFFLLLSTVVRSAPAVQGILLPAYMVLGSDCTQTFEAVCQNVVFFLSSPAPVGFDLDGVRSSLDAGRKAASSDGNAHLPCCCETFLCYIHF